MKTKSEVTMIFMKFKKWIELQFDHKIKSFQTGYGLEFKKLSHTLENYGIDQRFFYPYAH